MFLCSDFTIDSEHAIMSDLTEMSLVSSSCSAWCDEPFGMLILVPSSRAWIWASATFCNVSRSNSVNWSRQAGDVSTSRVPSLLRHVLQLCQCQPTNTTELERERERERESSWSHRAALISVSYNSAGHQLMLQAHGYRTTLSIAWYARLLPSFCWYSLTDGGRMARWVGVATCYTAAVGEIWTSETSCRVQ